MGLCAVLLAGGSCRPLRPPDPQPDAPLPSAALHAVHSEDLRRSMARMQRLVFDRMPQELDPRVSRRLQARRIADIAANLADAARHLPEALPERALDPAERDAFLRFALDLQHQAEQLETLARDHQLDALPPAVDQLTATCVACHNAFRDLPRLQEEERRQWWRGRRP